MIALLFAAAVAAAPPCAGVKNPPLCRDLMEIGERHAAARAKNVKEKDAQKIDAANLARVQAIVNQFEWPGKSLVGEQASAAAWTIVDHASLATTKKYLPAMQKAADDGQLSRALLAATIDRIAVREGRPQTYGTQPGAPIEDAAGVNDRRAGMGLPPLQQ